MATAAPAAPAAPAATAAPAAAPDPAAIGAQAPVKFDDGVDAELAALDAAGDAIRPAPASAPPKPKAAANGPAAPAKPPVKPAAEKPPGEVDPPEPAAGTAPDPNAAKPPEKDSRPPNMRRLADLYESTKQKIDTHYEPEIQRLSARVKELETANPGSDPDTEKTLTSLRARNQELEGEIRFKDYSKSEEFKTKYKEPYQRAFAGALRDLNEIVIDTGDGGTRRGNQQDLIGLLGLELGPARAKAREMFGDSADDVMAHYREVRKLWDSQQDALEEAQKNAGTREQTIAKQRQESHREALREWDTQNTDLAKKYPAWFAPAEDDPEGNAVLERGFALADLKFRGGAELTPEQVELLPERFQQAIKRGKFTVQDKVALDALIRNKAANHDRAIRRVHDARKRIKELETELAQYRRSEPGGGADGQGPGAGEPAGDGAVTTYEAGAAELDAIDAKH